MTVAGDDKIALIRAVDRVLAWPGMKKSATATRLLDHLAKMSIRGTENITAYHIAFDVLGLEGKFFAGSDIQALRVQSGLRFAA